jgi:hypothetical protein
LKFGVPGDIWESRSSSPSAFAVNRVCDSKSVAGSDGILEDFTIVLLRRSGTETFSSREELELFFLIGLSFFLELFFFLIAIGARGGFPFSSMASFYPLLSNDPQVENFSETSA